MKRIRKGLAAIVIAGVFVYTFNVQYFTYFLSLVCDSAIECVSGGNEASARLTEELNTLSVSKFIRLTVNGKDIDLDDTDFGQDFYDDIVSAQETTEEAEGETGSGKRDNKTNIDGAINNGQPLDNHRIVPYEEATSLPVTKQPPNSSADLLNPDGSVKQRRYYDEEGKAQMDIDFNHTDDGTHEFPHIHIWDWTKDPPRQDSRS